MSINFWRRLLASCGVAAACVLLGASPSAASDALVGSFSVHFPKSGEPAPTACDPDAFCGVGTLAGYGPATITVLEANFAEIPGSDCLSVELVEAVELLNQEGTLILHSTGEFCTPGASGEAPTSPASFGHPGGWDLAFTVVTEESTGVFAGATGSGTDSFHSAGAIGHWKIIGDITI